MVAAQAVGPSRPPANIEDFLWNVHSTLVATPGPLALEHLKEAYSKHLGHKCAIERFLVVGEGGLAATLKRIPHVVTLFEEGGTICVKATQAADINKQQLIEADLQYRKELIKKNAAAKAKAAAGKAAAAPAPKASGAAAAPAGPSEAAKAPPPAAADSQAKRPAEGQAAGADAKKPRADSDAETLTRMLVQGVVRVLQNRTKAGKGPLPLSELDEEFKALWKVPFNLQQAGEQDAVTFLQKWPNKVEVVHDGTQHVVQLPKKNQEKAKAGDAQAAAKAGAGPAPGTAAAPGTSPAGAPKAVPPKPAAPAGVAGAAAAKPPVAAKAPATVSTAAKSPVTQAAGAKAPVATAAPAGGAATAKPAVEAAAAAKSGPVIPKRAGGPTRPPASIEDFLWNIHSVIDAFVGPMPLDQLKDAYSKHLGHKCAIERFLVVGDGGLAATLKRIPHIVVVTTDKDGNASLKPALPSGTTREQLVEADHQYRRQLQQKNALAKAKPAAAGAGVAKGASPAAGAAPAGATAATTTAAAPAAASAPGAAKAPAAAGAGAGPAVGEKRPAEAAAAGETAKRPRPEDADTLARMLVQGIVRVLQNRQKDGKGPLPVQNLEEEFKALWKVPFNLAQAGETDVVTFLQKWPNKVEVVSDGSQHVVQLAKKAAEKAKGVPAAVKAAPPAAAPAPADGEAAKKASPAAAVTSPAKTGAVSGAVPSKGASPAKAAAAGAAVATSPAAAATVAGQAASAAMAAPAAAASASAAAAAVGRPAAASPKDTASSTAGSQVARSSPRDRDDDATADVAAEEPGSADADEGASIVMGDQVDTAAVRARLATHESSRQTLPEICQEAESVLHTMQEMLRKQEVLVGALRRLSAEEGAAAA